jgi:hypothetical protein
MSLSRRHLMGLLFAPREDDWVDVDGGAIPGFCWEKDGGTLHALAPREAFHDLRSAAEFIDFEFSFEFRLAPQANSGVKYMLHKVDVWSRGAAKEKQARARGFEFQLIDDEAEDARKDPTHTCGALYGILAPSVRTPDAADGRFHTAKIRRVGPRVEHHIDGRLVLEANLESREVAARCARRKMPPYAELAARKSPVALQHHNSQAWFRSLRLRAPG